jgi:hypothetical protein
MTTIENAMVCLWSTCKEQDKNVIDRQIMYAQEIRSHKHLYSEWRQMEKSYVHVNAFQLRSRKYQNGYKLST